MPSRLVLALLPLLSAGCAATQEVRAMHRELSVQIGRVEENITREAQKIRDENARARGDAQKTRDELRDLLAKTRTTVEQEVGALRAKLGELSEAVAELKKGVRAAGTSGLADLEVRAVGENHYRVS